MIKCEIVLKNVYLLCFRQGTREISMQKVSIILSLLSLELNEPPVRTEKMMDRTSKHTESDRESRSRM